MTMTINGCDSEIQDLSDFLELLEEFEDVNQQLKESIEDLKNSRKEMVEHIASSNRYELIKLKNECNKTIKYCNDMAKTVLMSAVKIEKMDARDPDLQNRCVRILSEQAALFMVYGEMVAVIRDRVVLAI